MKARGKNTGSIFKPKGSRFWWIAYWSGGKRHFESTKSELKGTAQDRLTDRLGDTLKGLVVTPRIGKKTLGQGIDAFIDNLTMNGRKGVKDARRKTRRLLDYFKPERLMATISGGDIEAYKAHRLEQQAAPATVNRELAALRRAYRLAVDVGDLVVRPSIKMLRENNTRKGFFERAELDAVLAHLPTYLHAPLRFAFLTGWRLHSEVLPLTVGQVDLKAGVVRLEVGSTKNTEGRSIVVTDELRKLLKAQLVEIEALKQRDQIVSYVFHRPSGKQIKNFRTLWKSACEAAGYPGKLLHDFRRSAVRNLERAAVPRSVAMAMVGHKTESIYRRYAIVDEQMHREAAAKINAWTVDQRAKASAERRGQLRRFKQRQTA